MGVGHPGMTSELPRAAARPAGIHRFSDSDRNVCANGPFVAVHALGVKGQSPVKIARAMGINLQALWRAFSIIRDFSPHRVIGTGGYVTGMVVLAARLCAVECAIQEQNARPGLTNRILAYLVQRIYLGFPDISRAFPAHKTCLCGNPVRELIAPPGGPPGGCLLIMGGSLGSHSLNTCAVEALRLCREQGLELTVLHQTGQADLTWVREAYHRVGQPAEVFDFTNDMASLYKRARLVVCRAGGLSLSELSRLGIPAVMVPYPHAADDHQMANARYVSGHEAGWIIPESHLTPERLALEIGARLSDGEGLAQAAQRMKDLSLGDGAKIIAQELLRV